MSARIYITTTSLAILAHPTFQLLYDRVANGSIHVVMELFRRNRVSQLECCLSFFGVGVKSPSLLHLKLHEGNLATLFIGQQVLVPTIP
ncbi:Secreted protein [Pseudomonas mediterranea]